MNLACVRGMLGHMLDVCWGYVARFPVARMENHKKNTLTILSKSLSKPCQKHSEGPVKFENKKTAIKDCFCLLVFLIP